MRLLVLLFLTPLCFASTDCQTTVTTTNASRIAFCITENGNIVNLEGPPGFVQIQGGEGYGVCPFAGGEYYDVGVYGDSGNWNPSVITQPHGPNTFPLTISRTPADNKFTFTQTFKLVSAGKAVGVTMKFLGPVSNVIRYAEIQPQAQLPQLGSHTSTTAFVWSETEFGFMAKPTFGAGVWAGITAGGIANLCSPSGGNGNLATILKWPTSSTRASTLYFEYTPMR